jgi:hypothetical protein
MPGSRGRGTKPPIDSTKSASINTFGDCGLSRVRSSMVPVTYLAMAKRWSQNRQLSDERDRGARLPSPLSQSGPV